MKMCSTKVLMWLVFTASSYGGRNSLAWAQAPANDACTNAAALTIGGTPQIVNLLNAVPGETGAPNQCPTGAVWGTSKGVWYTFTGTGARVAIPACVPNFLDASINVYSGAACGTTTLTCVVFQTNGCTAQRTMFDTVAGTKYYVAYSSFDATTVANSNLVVSLVNASVPSNDVCSGATPLTIGGPSVTGDISFATADVNQVINENDCAGGTTTIRERPGLWYSFVGTGSRLWITTCFAASMPNHISIYKGSCGGATLQCVTGTYDSCTLEKFMLTTEVGVTYYMLVRSRATTSQANTVFELQIRNVTAPPPNDVCSAAVPIAIGSTVSGNISFATADVNQVVNENDCAGGTTTIRERPGLWYSFVGTGSRLWIATCFAGSMPTFISIYKGSCGGASLQCVTGTYDSCTLEKFMFTPEVGVTYYMLVRSRSTGETNPFFDVLIRAIPTVTNDVCSTATPIAIGRTVSGNVTFATSDEGEILSRTECDGGFNFFYVADRPGLWYSFQGTGGRVWVSTCFEGSAETYISIYKGSCGASTLQCVTGTFDSCALEKFMLTTDVGTTYFVLVRTRSTAARTNPVFDLLIRNIPTLTNDVCSTATPITIGTSISGNITFATPDVGEISSGECDGGFNYFYVGGRPGLWYSFQGTGGRVWASTCLSGSTSAYISVYKGASCGASNLQCVTGTINPCTSTRLIFTTDTNTTYFVLVRSAETNPRTNKIISLRTTNFASSDAVNINANDQCTNAAVLAVGTSVVGNVTLATADEIDVPSDCLAGNPIGARPGLWYRFNGTGSSVVVDTCTSNTMATHVSVYRGTCGSSTLQCVAGTYDTCALPKFAVATEAGTVYYVLVRSASTATTGSRIFDLSTHTVSTPLLTLPPVAGPPVNVPVTVPSSVVNPTPPSPPTPTLRPPMSAPMVPVPTAPVIPTAPIPTVTAPVPVGAPRAPVSTAPVPVGAPTAPATAPAAGPKKCGLLGFRLFCPVTRCGLVGRLLGICKK